MITYHLDYRSPPSGLGTITLKNGDQILIQAQDEQIEVKDGIYSEIIVLKNSFEDYVDLQKEVIMTLLGYGVTHVYDPEACDSVIKDKNGYMHIKDYVNIIITWIIKDSIIDDIIKDSKTQAQIY